MKNFLKCQICLRRNVWRLAKMELEQILSENKNYIHASNIRTKLKGKNSCEANNLKKIYENYIKKIKQINHNENEEKIISEKVKFLNAYYEEFDKGNFGNIFSSQSKLRSTILEEFLCILFEDLICKKQEELKTDNLKAGGVKAYSNLYFSSENLKQFVFSPIIGINQKDQDYAIYRSLNLVVNRQISKEINLPIVSIEAKTYIDKTMLEGSIATAEKIKSGNPYAKFFMVAETYEVDQSVDPAYSRIDQIYVLRKSYTRGSTSPIDFEVVHSLYTDVENHLNRDWGNIKQKLSKFGKVI